MAYADFSGLAYITQMLINSDPSVTNYFTSANLSVILNLADIDMNKDCPCIESTGEVYTVGTTADYALSASYMTGLAHMSIRSVSYNSYILAQASDNDLCWQYGDTKPSGKPTKYRIWNNAIELDKYPGDIKPLGIRFFKRPTWMLNNGDDPGCAQEYHMAICLLAAAYLTCKGNDVLRENKFYQRYQMELGRIKNLRRGSDGTYAIPLDGQMISDRKHSY